MSMPVITARDDVVIRERPPPPRERTKMHKWLSGRSLERYATQEARASSCTCRRWPKAEDPEPCPGPHGRGKEVMGFLLGRCAGTREGKYTLVRDVATTDLGRHRAVSVRFRRSAFDKLFEELDSCDFKYVIVGWYHSHPSYTCFMSATDIQTQRTMFNQRYHSAIVIDPVNKEIEAFYRENDRVESRPFAVYWDEHQNPYYGGRCAQGPLSDRRLRPRWHGGRRRDASFCPVRSIMMDTIESNSTSAAPSKMVPRGAYFFLCSSRDDESSRTMLLACPSLELGLPVMDMTVAPTLRTMFAVCTADMVSPVLETMITTSSLDTMGVVMSPTKWTSMPSCTRRTANACPIRPERPTP